MNRNKYNVEQAVQFILNPGDESELSDLDKDDDNDEIPACKNHRVEIEDDIEGDDISEVQVNEMYPHLFLIRHLVGNRLMYHQKTLKS